MFMFIIAFFTTMPAVFAVASTPEAEGVHADEKGGKKDE
jgi:hypothetical protein